MYPWLLKSYQLLQNSLEHGSLHHAIIFYGKQGVGKSRLAAQLSQALLCQTSKVIGCGQCKACQLYLAGSHPDFYLIKPEGQIGVDDIREATNKLSASSHLMQAKVLVIHDAHKMTVAAANSLLKTLEEPTKDTYLFLLTDKMDKLLPTIKSRCQKYVVEVAQQQQVAEWLEQEQLVADPALVSLYWSRPLYLQQLLSDQDANVLKQLPQDIELLKQRAMSSDAFANKYAEHLELSLEWMQLFLKQQMQTIPDEQHDKFWQCYQSLIETSSRMHQTGINKPLLFTSFVTSLQNTLGAFS